MHKHIVLHKAPDAEDTELAQLCVNQAFSWNTSASVVMLGFLNYNPDLFTME
jgi:hypothetical protein